MTEYLQVTTSTESQDTAITLARSVVQARLAAGAQILGPMTSVVWHLGEVGEGEEWQVIFKTRSDSWTALEAHILDAHPWEKPEVTAVTIVAGSNQYFDWINRTLNILE
jgi:periplasmic divalent cation tolerance protein